MGSPAAALGHVRRHPGHRVLVVCESVSDEARFALLADTRVDLSAGSTGELVLSGKTFRAPATAPPAATAERDWRRRAAERVCVLTHERVRQVDIAAAVAVTQRAVSKMTEKNPLPDTPRSRVPYMAVIEHTGRRSGRRYRTPVMAFIDDGTISVVLNYGERSDWVRNVQATGSAEVAHGGNRYHLTDPHVLSGDSAAQKPRLVATLAPRA